MMWIAVASSAFVAGMIQTVTGFGAGVLLIAVLTFFFDMITAPALNTSICLSVTSMLAWHHRKEIDKNIIALPIAFYSLTSAAVIYVVEYIDLNVIAISFGIFLIALSIYFLFFTSKIHLRPSLATAIPCSVISGLFSGLFGVGGPVLGLYLITITDRHEKYLGNIQFLFTVTNIVNFVARIMRGIYTVDLIPISLIGASGIIAGALVGSWVCRKLNIAVLKKIIYIFVGVSGVITLVRHLF